MTNTEIVAAAFDAFREQDLALMERLLADEFVFTSPQDDHIDRDTFLRTCFPAAGQISDQRVLLVTEGSGGTVFVLYEYVGTTGDRHRNTECLTVREGRIVETQVFFGGRY